ncbi:MAG: DUF192 domain-containing protein [Pseudomonadales bacterium]|nr:DUF192 domain-containing protein [Pseudomonadales bacterium]
MSPQSSPIFKRLQALCVVLLLLLSHPSILNGQLASPLYRNPHVPMVVNTVDGATIHLKTVIVSKPEDLRQGLMHVRHLPTNVTMLFLYERPQTASMWMKNTRIPLDMWWVDTNSTIRHIEHHTTPHSLESISYPRPVRAVVEINAGLSRLLGISVGSKIEFVDP